MQDLVMVGLTMNWIFKYDRALVLFLLFLYIFPKILLAFVPEPQRSAYFENCSECIAVRAMSLALQDRARKT
jgi:hypothetical protein